ncbi:hypothetical protein X777_00960 [Ooceraea biroi]|uniref:Uncharacterized protein n=1 Tax=Ooceraea biroi TaxID=2015173 RepID=A0A026WPF9_OOCBI|nr:hypothetical protein X777_00960 [Ooceraea biroi]
MVSLTRDGWHYGECRIVCAIESAERANFGRALSLIRGGSPLDHEERCLIGSLSDFGKFDATSKDKRRIGDPRQREDVSFFPPARENFEEGSENDRRARDNEEIKSRTS